MKKAPAKEGYPTPKPPAGDSSKMQVELVAKPPVVAQITLPIHDIRTERQSTSVPEPTTAEDPKEAAFLRELEEKFGSKEEARRIFALFPAMHQGKSTGTITVVPPSPTIPEEPTAQPSISHPDAPQASVRAPAFDQSQRKGPMGRRMVEIWRRSRTRCWWMMWGKMLVKGKPMWKKVWRGEPLV